MVGFLLPNTLSFPPKNNPQQALGAYWDLTIHLTIVSLWMSTKLSEFEHMKPQYHSSIGRTAMLYR